MVTLSVWAELRPSPQRNDFVFHPQIGRDSPTPGGEMPAGWPLAVVGPPPPRLVLSRDGPGPDPWVFVVPRAGEGVTLRVTPR